jgi:chromosome partitioning protein
VKTIAIVSQKGGVGKTTTAVTLAHGLALEGMEVLLLDTDPQGQCATLLDLDHEPGVFRWLGAGEPVANVVRETGRDRLRLLPGDKRTVEAQLLLNYRGETLDALRSTRSSLEDLGADVVVMDTAPSVGGLQDAAIMAADEVVVPVACDYLSLERAPETFRTLAAVRDRGWAGQLAGVQPTFYSERTNIARESLEDLNTLAERLGLSESLLRPIHESAFIRSAASEGRTIWEIPARTEYDERAQLEYVRLVRHVRRAITARKASAHGA